MVLLVSAFPSITPATFFERSGSKKRGDINCNRFGLRASPLESGTKGPVCTELICADALGSPGWSWDHSMHLIITSCDCHFCLSCLAGQTRNFDGNFCTPECIDIWHFPGTEPITQPALGWTPVGLILHFLSLPPMCGCLIWKGQSLQRVCLRRNEQVPALPLNTPQTNKQQKSCLQRPSFPQEFLQNTANA